jgi:hypothetical protein
LSPHQLEVGTDDIRFVAEALVEQPGDGVAQVTVGGEGGFTQRESTSVAAL